MREMDLSWNPWHGCTKISEGCKNCWMFSMDKKYEKDSTIVRKTNNFDLPIKVGRDKRYKLRQEVEGDNLVRTCFTSDFFHPAADGWRREVWNFIKKRQDLIFVIFTKRIDRFQVSMLINWEDGYDNVVITCSCENQARADERLSILSELPIKHRAIALSPQLERITLTNWLSKGCFELVCVSGESCYNAKSFDYDWALQTRDECKEFGVKFNFFQTGSAFYKDGRLYNIPNMEVQKSQASNAGIDII